MSNYASSVVSNFPLSFSTPYHKFIMRVLRLMVIVHSLAPSFERDRIPSRNSFLFSVTSYRKILKWIVIGRKNINTKQFRQSM